MAVSDRLAGQRVKCVHCGEIVDVPRDPSAAPAPARVPAPAPRPAAQVPCPYCSSMIAPGLSACPYCNENLLRRAAPGAPPPSKGRPGMRRCAACAEEINAHDTVCPYCGSTPGHFAAQRLTPAMTVPWEDEPQAGFFSRWWRTWSASLFQPDPFFRSLRYQGGFQTPLMYVMGFVGQLLGLAMLCGGPLLFIFLMSPDARGPGNREIPAAMVVGFAALYVVMFVGATAAGTFIYSGILHVTSMMMGGRGSFEATYRACCYSWGSAVFGLVPYIGGVIQLVFQIIALTHGLSYAHGISKTRGFFAAFLPMLVCCGLGVAFIIVAMAGAVPRR